MHNDLSVENCMLSRSFSVVPVGVMVVFSVVGITVDCNICRPYRCL